MEGIKTFCGAKHAKNQDQGDFWYYFKYILEIIGGGLKNKYISGIIGGQIKIFSERLL